MSRHSARSAAYQRLRDEWLWSGEHGWVCHLCRRPVSPDVPSGSPQSPSVDHIIPASVAPDLLLDTGNWLLAHLVCNQRRRDRAIVKPPKGATRQW